MCCTLDSGINVAPWINVAPGIFGKKNKHIPLHQITELWIFLWITLFNKDIAPGKNPKVNKHGPMFIPESRVVSRGLPKVDF